MRLEIVVQAVAAQAAQQGSLLGLRLWDIADIDARGIALVLDVEAELLLLDIGSQIVDVLHHQRPVELLRIVGRILQRLDIERLLGCGMVGGKLTDVVGLTIIGVLVGYCQHLVALQRGLQRDVAQGAVQRILGSGQQACGRQLLKVFATRHHGTQDGRRLVDVASGGIGSGQGGILAIGTVIGDFRLHSPTPLWRRTLCQIGKGEDVARIAGRSRLVGHPHLYASNVDTRSQRRQLLHGGIVALAEILAEEEVAVFLVVGDIEFEGGELCATLGRDTLGGGVLLRDDSLQLELTKLHIRADTKQAAGTLDERVVGGERDIASLNEFDDFVLLALVAQLQVLGIPVGGGIGVVVERHVDLIAHLTRHIDIDFLVEVDGLGLTVALRQRGVVDILEVGTQLQFGSTLRLDAHTTRTENLLGRTEVEVHIGKVELLLALVGYVLGILLAEEALALLALAPLAILLGSHQHGGVQIGVAHLRAQHIDVQGVVILHLPLDILREVQVEGAGVEVGHLYGCRLLYLPASLGNNGVRILRE